MAQCLSVFIIDFIQGNTGLEAAFTVFFFYISIYWGYYALPCHDLKASTQEEKTIFKIAKSITKSNIFAGK